MFNKQYLLIWPGPKLVKKKAWPWPNVKTLFAKHVGLLIKQCFTVWPYHKTILSNNFCFQKHRLTNSAYLCVSIGVLKCQNAQTFLDKTIQNVGKQCLPAAVFGKSKILSKTLTKHCFLSS